MTTTKYAEIIATANAEALATSNAVSQQIEEAREALPLLETAMYEAEGAPDDVLAAWRSGDTSLSPLAYAEAQGAALLAQEMHAGAKARLASVERQRPNTDTTAALAVAAFLTDHAIAGIPIHVASVNMTDPPRKAELPLMVAVQNEATVQSPSGYISGAVELTYWHDELIHREVTKETIEHAASLAGMGVTVTARPGVGGQQKIRVNLTHGHTGTPRIANISPVENIATILAGSVAGVVPGPGKVRLMQDRTYESSRLAVAILKAEQRVTARHEDGTREVVATVQLGLSERGSVTHDVRALVTQLVTDHKGMFLAGHGIVTDAQIRPIASERHLYSFEITLTLASAE